MNCDQVFDILTRGPFPTGTDCDMPVEEHLSVCVECHRLAEALRPAVELFQEAVDPEESRDLPGYWCASTSELTARELEQVMRLPGAALSYARPLESNTLEPRQDRGELAHGPALALWRMAAMIAIGVTVGTLLAARGIDGLQWPMHGHNAGLLPPGDTADRATWSNGNWNDGNWIELASLPAACYLNEPAPTPRYRLGDDQLLAHPRLRLLDCCSGCHHAQAEQAPRSATLQVARSCQQCHTAAAEPRLSAR